MEDKIIKLFKELIDKAMQKELQINFLGIRHAKKPDFISITHKEYYKQKIGVKENGRPMHGVTSDGGILIDAYIGDSRGFGKGSVAVEGVGRDESSIRRNTEPRLEEAITKALVNYSEKALASGLSDPSLFYILSKEPVVESIDPVPPKSRHLINEKQAVTIEQELKTLWDQFCARKDIVKKADLMIRSTSMTRRFVNSEGTAIRSHNFRAYYRIDLDILADDLRIVECTDTPYYAMTREKIEKYPYVHNKRMQSLMEHIVELSKSRPLIPPATGAVKCPVYFGARAFNNFIHEPLAHPKEGTEKLGQALLPSFITVFDDPTYRFGHGYIQYDDEGVKGQKTLLIKDGVRNDILLDRNTAGKLARHSNGHARSEWVFNKDEATGETSIGTPQRRVTNLFTRVSNGVSTKKLHREFMEYINKYKFEYGMMFRGGLASINPETRDFELTPFSIFKVYANGKKEMVSGARISEDPTALTRIARCGNEYSRSFGICGDDSGCIPDCSTGPDGFVEEVTFKEIPERRLKKRPA